MPRVSRSRTVATEPSRVWELVSDPHSLPRWWPKALRVEDVRDPGGRRARWTTVLATERGTGVRADYRCTGSTSGVRYAWEQEVDGTPFDRILKASQVEIGLARDPGGTKITLTSDESLRGLSRLGSSLMRGATRRRLEEALTGIERALVADHDDA
jgi:uncharacterized protein YndB with AHSA1/START domain